MHLTLKNNTQIKGQRTNTTGRKRSAFGAKRKHLLTSVQKGHRGRIALQIDPFGVPLFANAEIHQSHHQIK